MVMIYVFLSVHPSTFHGKQNWPRGNYIKKQKAHLLLQEGVLFVRLKRQ